MKRKHILLLAIASFFSNNNLWSQTNVIINPTVTYQTIHGFGASDAWNADFVGKYWNNSVKSDIAKKLFSKNFLSNGNPEGIGLSRWRFNIGAGSAEQGTASNIEMAERRAECFLNEDGSYNWNKQSGQQWFLTQAKTYGVENLVAFVNSPPRFFTKNGRANSDNTNRYGNTNLKDDAYDEYAKFLAAVLNNFKRKGIPFSQISPINEPQYEWNEGQEGCPWLNTEISRLAKELSKTLVDSGLDTKILLSEAASFKDLYSDNGNADKANQIWKFFSSSRTEYIGNLSNMLYGLGGHSYWTDGDDATIRSVRQDLYNKSVQYGKIELYQTEYNLLSKSFSDYLTNAVFLAKIMYADLAIANVSVWDYWTAMERERWSQLNRFYLIRLMPSGGDYADLTTGGTVVHNKNLWALGNYSLFIRPGFKRIMTSGADNLAGLMCSSYISPDSLRIVSVYVNISNEDIAVNHKFENIFHELELNKITPYITNSTNNLTVKSAIPTNSAYTIPAMSVVTLVADFQKKNTNIDQNQLDNLKVYPNSTTGIVNIQLNANQLRAELILMDVSGKKMIQTIVNTENHILDISSKPAGIYFLQLNNEKIKIVKQ